MLALGVPGSPTAAVLLGGLLIWGLQPGPMLFVEQKEFVWGLIASMYLGNIVGLIVVLTTVPLFAAILRIPFSIIAPVILVICAIGAYTVNNNVFDVVMMLVFGVVGYVMKKTNYPLAPLVLAIVLGDSAEEAFRQSLLASQGSIGIFWSNPLVSTIMGLGLDRPVLADAAERLQQVPRRRPARVRAATAEMTLEVRRLMRGGPSDRKGPSQDEVHRGPVRSASPSPDPHRGFFQMDFLISPHNHHFPLSPRFFFKGSGGEELGHSLSAGTSAGIEPHNNKSGRPARLRRK